jgi:hypothetical protein
MEGGGVIDDINDERGKSASFDPTVMAVECLRTIEMKRVVQN